MFENISFTHMPQPFLARSCQPLLGCSDAVPRSLEGMSPDGANGNGLPKYGGWGGSWRGYQVWPISQFFRVIVVGHMNFKTNFIDNKNCVFEYTWCLPAPSHWAHQPRLRVRRLQGRPLGSKRKTTTRNRITFQRYTSPPRSQEMVRAQVRSYFNYLLSQLYYNFIEVF